MEIRRIVESAHTVARDLLTEHRSSLNRISEILLKRETIERDQFVALLNGDSEEEVFGSEAPPPPQLPMPPATPERTGDTPKLFPRPGYAGGTAE